MHANYLAVLVAALAHSALGAIWYSPLLFGKKWMELCKKTPEEIKLMKNGAFRAYAQNFIGTYVLVYVMGQIFWLFNIHGVSQGLQIASWLWLGFIPTVNYATVIFEKRPLGVYLMQCGHQLLGFLAIGAIISTWP